ncbi:MAG: selenium-binding protein SBP56-related protein, partial [Chloroflexus sp.]|uniref:selenium-binding protein SBP56-related protein n=1 Tax=Chloroflexus sp. TaxID=1904827 RepID=UPI00404AF521
PHRSPERAAACGGFPTVNPDSGMQLDPNFFVDFGDWRVHQIRLQGGDASSDSYCFP